MQAGSIGHHSSPGTFWYVGQVPRMLVQLY